MSISNRQPSVKEQLRRTRQGRGEPLAFIRHSRRWLGWASAMVVLAVLVTGPGYLNLYTLSIGFTLFNFMILALSWNLIGGYGGQFSLGHAIFVGAGSYTVAVLLLHTGIPLYLAVPLSGVLAALIAALSGLLLLRLRSAYFSVGTLGIALAGLSWMINWSYTGGTQELSLPSSLTLDYSTLYYASLSVLVLTIVCLVALIHSSFGLRLMAVRDDEDAAAELGVNSFLVKMTAFTVSAFFVGLAGALIALQNVSIEPNSAFSLDWTVSMIIMSVLGGLATTTGPLIGAVVIFTLQQQLQGYGSWSTLVIGLLLIIVIRIAPEGIWMLLRQGIQRLVQMTVTRQPPSTKDEHPGFSLLDKKKGEIGT
ncbi:MAG: branched-chain amino acid ABC transporter permease [Ktedonobacteraceae bacterium]|nr:branched-chain amino acid ABC transporter permease [Ktedonobacteraceae bacterium]